MVFQGLLLLLLLCGVVYGNTPPHPTGTPPHTTVTPPHTTVPPQPTDSECESCIDFIELVSQASVLFKNATFFTTNTICQLVAPEEHQFICDFVKEIQDVLSDVADRLLVPGDVGKHRGICSHLFRTCTELTETGEPLVVGEWTCKGCKSELPDIVKFFSTPLIASNKLLARYFCGNDLKCIEDVGSTIQMTNALFQLDSHPEKADDVCTKNMACV